MSSAQQLQTPTHLYVLRPIIIINHNTSLLDTHCSVLSVLYRPMLAAARLYSAVQS